MKCTAVARSLLLAAAMLGAPIASAVATPMVNYSLLTTIAVPETAANSQGGAFTSFDIGFADATGYYYIADRSNASVDIINGATLQVVAQPGGFTGQQATTSTSGPDGVLVAGTTLFAGNGTSNVLSFNVSTPATPTSALPPISTGGNYRADEMSYSPTANLILVANNADSPAFATLVNATTGAVVHGHITIPGAGPTDGLEQSVWDPSTGTFFISVPSFNGDQGGVAEILTDGTVGRLFKFASMAGGPAGCSPTGLALGASGNLMVGCGAAGSQTVLLNPAGNAGAGSIVSTFAQISGSDELWYDGLLNDFFVTGIDASNGRAFDVISDSTDTVLQSVALPNVSAHSIAVDPLTGDVFVPLSGTTSATTDDLCPRGCIAVYAQNVPEPGTVPILITALLGLAGVSAWRRRAEMRRF